jgi:propionyl-CoA carboxylase alpha chain
MTAKKKITSLLVANRGEIALRVMKSAREMGLRVVAVYSEADRTSPHVQFADDAVLVGPPPSAQSYLVFDNIIRAAKDTGCEAIHPGYGFLSENPAFARKVKEEGLILVGPSPEAMEVMGSKLAAKEAVKKYDIPLVPGTDYAITDIEKAKAVAAEIGFPILIKASAGGGGKGMRIVDDPSQFEEMMQTAVNEATSAFGDGSVFIERYVASPRHIEVQVLGDMHGNIVHLFERECSVQRRHQKVIEEAPSSVLTPEIRKAMGESAVMVAKACDYVGAGTVEFLLDENLNYYFLEMNTRLQVEHPVTELITGKDLVKEQIMIAAGEKIGFSQNDLSINGHSIEVRVYAEDPLNNFLPDIGKLTEYSPPHGPGIRVDDGFEVGMEIPIYYDPMISKLIVWGSTREEAIERMIGAIEQYRITGVRTTLEFCRFVLKHDAFRSGNFDTHFVQHYFTPEALDPELDDQEKAAALITALESLYGTTQKPVNGHFSASEVRSNWKRNRLDK